MDYLTFFIPSPRRPDKVYETMIKQGHIHPSQSLTHLCSALLGPGCLVGILSCLFSSSTGIETLKIGTAISLLSFSSAKILPKSFPRLSSIQRATHLILCAGLLVENIYFPFTTAKPFDIISSVIMIVHIFSILFLENKYEYKLITLPKQMENAINDAYTEPLNNEPLLFVQNSKPSWYYPARATQFFIWGLLFFYQKMPAVPLYQAFHLLKGAKILIYLRLCICNYWKEKNIIQKGKAQLKTVTTLSFWSAEKSSS